MEPSDKSPRSSPEAHRPRCCIVGGGPGGIVMGLLLARAGVPVSVLEAHHDFDRDFRGDTIHPNTLEVLEQVGLADALHELPHEKLRAMNLVTADGTRTLAKFDRLGTKYPYVMIMPQSRFLDFLADRAKQYPTFHLEMGANVKRLLEEDGVVTGVSYQKGDAWHEVHAPLTVAADGRFSRLRKLADFTPISSAPEMDVLWLRLPRRDADAHDEGMIYAGNGFMVLLNREHEWHAGYALPKGGFRHLKEQGLDALRSSIVDLIPWLSDRIDCIESWQDVHMLSVESSRLPTWHKPGLLLIGDAAHTMSPVGGLGINYAIGDAIEAINVLTVPLLEGTVKESHLAQVQTRRERPVKFIQWVQGQMQQRLVGEAIDRSKPFSVPLALRILLKIPFLRNLPARLVAFGLRRVRLEHPERVAID